MRIPIFQHNDRARAPVMIIGLVFLLCSLTSLALASVRPEIAYSVRSHFDQNLYSINLTTGVATKIGPTGFTDIEGLTFDAKGVLYAYDAVTKKLLTCDPATGHCTPVASTGISVRGVGLTFDDKGNLFLSSNNPRVLYQINPATGAAKGIALENHCICGLAFYNGVMYGLGGDNSNNLLRIDCVTGCATEIGPLRGVALMDGGIEFDRNGVLWGLEESGKLFTINPGSGAATQVGIVGPGFEGLATLPNRLPSTSSAAPSIGMLWPPDHGLVPINVLGITDPDGDETRITIDGITQDEPVNGMNDGHTCPDAMIDGSTARVRAERRTDGVGRVYVVSFTADDGYGGRRAGRIAVAVPHTRGLLSVDDGDQVFNSLEACDLTVAGDADVSGGKVPAGAALRTLPSAAGTASLEYSLPAGGAVQLFVYDLMGRRVAVVENGAGAIGTHRVTWNATGFPSGMYFAVLRTAGGVVRTPVVVLR